MRIDEAASGERIQCYMHRSERVHTGTSHRGIGLRNLAFLFLLSITASSCGQIPLEDVSSQAEYKHIVGMRFKAKQDLLLIGVTGDQNYKKQVDYFVLAPLPGFTGPEVVTSERISKDSLIRVVRVLQSKLFFIPRVYYIVEVPEGKPRPAPVQVRQTGSVQDQNRGLDPSVFEKLE